ncbi:hypothetical protein BX666DRAFT_1881825 [Dichotomocladium elegans]|nr:hypothetical protein BX666DRAFT_1881825 [Dichotomocladium elegans]
MSLLLTRTCEYAILVSLQKGRFFSHSTEHDIFIQSKLELHLPAAVDDLIPPASLISSAPVPISREGNVEFNTTLAYLISTKLLQRLREHDCEISLLVKSVTTDAREKTLGTFCLRVAEAKMVVHRGPAAGMDKVNRFVADRGEWQKLEKGEEVKAGLFIVAMPNEKNASGSGAGVTNATRSSSVRSPPPKQLPNGSGSGSRGNSVHSPMLELKSLDHISHASSTPLLFSDSVTTSTTTILSSPSSQRSFKQSRQNIDLNIERLANEFRQIKVKQSPQRPPSPHHHHHPRHPQRPTLPIHHPSPSPPSPPQARLSWPPPTPPSPSLTKNNHRQLQYHQIGKGQSQYTFYFRILDATHYRVAPRLNGRRGVARKPFFTYRFLSQTIQCPASSISTRINSSSNSNSSNPCSPLPSRSAWPTCFHLRGHLADIQQWLCDLRFLEVSLLLLSDDDSSSNSRSSVAGLLSKETVVGMAHVPLSNLTFYRRSRGNRHSLYESVNNANAYARINSSNICEIHPNLVERTFPVLGLNQAPWWRHHHHHHRCRDGSGSEGDGQETEKEKGDAIATVTVRFGLTSGWWSGEHDDDMKISSDGVSKNKEEPHNGKRDKSNNDNRAKTSFAKRPVGTHDLLDWFKKKKARIPSHHTSTS